MRDPRRYKQRVDAAIIEGRDQLHYVQINNGKILVGCIVSNLFLVFILIMFIAKNYIVICHLFIIIICL